MLVEVTLGDRVRVKVRFIGKVRTRVTRACAGRDLSTLDPAWITALMLVEV